MSEVLEQKKERMARIGGSDCAAVLGLSRWQTPLGLWAEKTGQVIETETPKLYQTLGLRLEEVVAELFMQETGKELRRANERRIHPKYPYLVSQIDRLVVGENAIWEGKTASAWKAKEWSGEEIPQEYILQVMHGLMVTGRAIGYIAVLIGNQDFKWKTIDRDEKLIREIEAREVEFMEKYILPCVMPSIITKDDAQTLYSLYPVADPDSEIELDDEAEKIIESRNALIQDKIHVEDLIEKQENELRLLLKEKETGRSARHIVTWKNQMTKRMDTTRFKLEQPDVYEQYLKETASRVLRVREFTGGKNG